MPVPNERTNPIQRRSTDYWRAMSTRSPGYHVDIQPIGRGQGGVSGDIPPSSVIQVLSLAIWLIHLHLLSCSVLYWHYQHYYHICTTSAHFTWLKTTRPNDRDEPNEQPNPTRRIEQSKRDDRTRRIERRIGRCQRMRRIDRTDETESQTRPDVGHPAPPFFFFVRQPYLLMFLLIDSGIPPLTSEIFRTICLGCWRCLVRLVGCVMHVLSYGFVVNVHTVHPLLSHS